MSETLYVATSFHQVPVGISTGAIEFNTSLIGNKKKLDEMVLGRMLSFSDYDKNEAVEWLENELSIVDEVFPDGTDVTWNTLKKAAIDDHLGAKAAILSVDLHGFDGLMTVEEWIKYGSS